MYNERRDIAPHDLHPPLTLGTAQRVDLIDLLNKLNPVFLVLFGGAPGSGIGGTRESAVSCFRFPREALL